MKNPEGYTKEQLKRINEDSKKQKIEMDAIEHNEFLKKRAKELEKLNEMEAMFGTKVSILPRPGIDLSRVKKKK